jgi:predicted O-methyltransferase YrrM
MREWIRCCRGAALSCAALAGAAFRASRKEPRLPVDYARLYLIRLYRNAPLGRSPLLDVRSPSRPLPWDHGPELIARTAGAWSNGKALELARSATARISGGSERSRAQRLGRQLASDPSLGELIYALVRATRPDFVIETGVATGLTSAFALAALEDNRHGELHSVDLPPGALIARGLVGSAIPPALRQRWRPRWGDARRLVPRILEQTGGRRVFLHDSDHGYQAMRGELECAWHALRSGDWIVADDVELHDAFNDVALAHGAMPYVIAQKDKSSCAGLMRRC